MRVWAGTKPTSMGNRISLEEVSTGRMFSYDMAAVTSESTPICDKHSELHYEAEIKRCCVYKMGSVAFVKCIFVSILWMKRRASWHFVSLCKSWKEICWVQQEECFFLVK